VIKTTKGKKPYQVTSRKGRNLGKYKTVRAARKRLRQIEYFKQAKQGLQ
jgi:hypothetical protein